MVILTLLFLGLSLVLFGYPARVSLLEVRSVGHVDNFLIGGWHWFCLRWSLLIAEDLVGRIIGTVQIIFAEAENQPHRADIAKMLVHRRARKRGVGAALLAAAEDAALNAGKTVLVLDTASMPDPGDFTVNVKGDPKPVVSVLISGTDVGLVMDKRYASGPITVSYSGTALQARDHTKVNPFTDFPVNV